MWRFPPLAVSLTITFIFFYPPQTYAQKFTVTQISVNTKNNQWPQINEKGDIVWQGKEKIAKKWQIFFYDAAAQTVIPITSDDRNNISPQINARDQIAWQSDSGHTGEIFLFDGKVIRQLTENFLDDRDPRINDKGQVVWEQKQPHDWEIMLYDGSAVTNISNNFYDDHNPGINNRGEVAWQGMFGNQEDKIYLYDANTKTTKEFGKTFHHNRNPSINDEGRIAWESEWNIGDKEFRFDTVGDQPLMIKRDVYRFWEIFFFDGDQTMELTYNRQNDRKPKINQKNDIVWERLVLDNWEICLWNYNPYYKGGDENENEDEDSIKNISDKPFDDINPAMNDEGRVVWQGFDGRDWEIFCYDGQVVSQLTNNDYDDTNPQINAKGEIVWQGFNGKDWEIFLARPQ